MTPSSRPETNRLVWFVMTFAVATVVTLSAGWATAMARQDERAMTQIRELEMRVSQLERHYEQISAKLDYLVEQARDHADVARSRSRNSPQ